MFTDAEWNQILELMVAKQKTALADGTMVEWTDPIGRKYIVHAPSKCEGKPCVFHNPTPHSMSDRPIILRETGLIERSCPHGIGHPDPDSVDYYGEGWGIHGCDGCCRSSSHPDESPSSTG
jgi:hypothetical protein